MTPGPKASAVALVLVLAGRSRADTALEARAALTAGATDNVLLDPVQQRSSAVTSARVGLFLDRMGNASTQALSYQVRAQGYTDVSANSTVFHSLAGSAHWEVGRAGSFSLGLSGTAGRMSALDPVLSAQLARTAGSAFGPSGATGVMGAPPTGTSPAPMQTLLGGRPAGQVLFAGGELRESYAQGIGESWRLQQLGSVAAYVPLEDAPFVRDAYFLQHIVGGEREFERGSAGLQLRLGQTMTSSLTTPEVMLPSTQLSFGEAWAHGSHDLLPTLELMAAAGSYAVWSFQDERYLGGPVWRGRATWQPRADARLNVEVSRSIQPSLMLGYTLRADAVTLEAGRALDRAERWAVVVGGSWMRGRQLRVVGDLGGTVNVAVARASLRYDPQGPLRFGVDVSHIDQGGQSSPTLVVPRMQQTLFLFLIEAIYPSRDRAGQKLMAAR